jgi:tellurite resistance protein
MNSRLQHFPIAFFAAVMGLSGLSMALGQAEWVLGWPSVPAGTFVGLVAGLVFLVLCGFYLAKLVRFRTAVLAELNHPVKMSFAATFPVSLVLLAVASLKAAPQLSAALWTVGVSLHLPLTLYVLNTWVYQPHFEIHHISPAWFIPVVGNILIPIAGVHHGGPELSWFFFAIGLVFWIVLFVIIIYRMIFHHPLPDRLLPTLFILIAPPAAGFLAYIKLSGGLDAFARVLYYAALFLTLWLLLQTPRFLKLPFFLSWWAYSFPLAAMTTASLTMYQLTGEVVLKGLSYLLLFLLIIVVGWLSLRTLIAIQQDAICVEES